MADARAERRCSRAESCPLFVPFTLEATLRIWKSLYCENNFESCVRYRRQARGCDVPPRIYPNGADLGVAVLPSHKARHPRR